MTKYVNLTDRSKLIKYLVGGMAAGFTLLTLFVYFVPDSVIDHTFSVKVQSYQHPRLFWLMNAISWPGYMPNTPVIIAIVAILFGLFKYKREALFIPLTSLSGLVSTLVKLLIDRPRPYEPLVKVMLKTHQQSFPSGHVLFYVVFFGFLLLLMIRLKQIAMYLRVMVSVVCVVLIITIPYSRVYLGAHWFTDVTAGFMLGIVLLYVLSSLYLKRSGV